MLSVAVSDIAIYCNFSTANHHISGSDLARQSLCTSQDWNVNCFLSLENKILNYLWQELRIYVIKYRYLVSLNSYNITTQNVVIFYCIYFVPKPLVFERQKSLTHTRFQCESLKQTALLHRRLLWFCSGDVWAAAARRRHRSDPNSPSQRPTGSAKLSTAVTNNHNIKDAQSWSVFFSNQCSWFSGTLDTVRKNLYKTCQSVNRHR